MYLNPYNQGLFEGLLGDPETENLFSSEKMLGSCIQFEIALTNALYETELLSDAAQDHINQKLKTFKPNFAKLMECVAVDGMAVPEFIRQLRNTIDPVHQDVFHFGSTSQDLIDSAFVLALIDYSNILNCRINSLLKTLDQLRDQFGSTTLQGRTRYQSAKLIKCEDRISSWSEILHHFPTELKSKFENCRTVQFGGPVGNRSEWGDKANTICLLIAQQLGLKSAPVSWQTNRIPIVGLTNCLIQFAGAIGKVGIDLLLMAQMQEVVFNQGGSSSAMPHKSNPIGAETIVAISNYLSSLSSGINHCLIHEQERSGSMWTLEWMIVPQVLSLSAKSCSLLDHTLKDIRQLGTAEIK
ncbi:MAG: lyase family protein [Rhodobacteraceae bacterium]|nr:lyase family protein [Paracoccaceae bacterium]